MRLFGKFRVKVTLFSTISIFGILLTILGAMNAYNFIMVSRSADETLSKIAELGGRIDQRDAYPKYDPDDNPSSSVDLSSQSFQPPIQPQPDIIENTFGADYFTYSFDSEGNATKIAFNMPNISENDAKAMAQCLLGKGDGWSEIYYRYKNYEYNGLDYITIINQKRELEPSYRILNASVIGGLIGVVFAFLMLIPVSRWMLFPIEYSVQRQKRFISDASHELKTPLSIISLNNDLEIVEKGESENTANISEQINLLNEMVKNLNELAKIDENEKIIFSSVDISKIANDEASAFEKLYESRNIFFDKSIEKNLLVQGNEEMLKKVFSLILDNAAKYSSSKVILTIRKENKKVIIQERNDCPNIQEGNLNAIFERFYRLQNDRSSDVGGSGIGLSVVKEIINRHKGQISAEGKDGNFILTIIL